MRGVIGAVLALLVTACGSSGPSVSAGISGKGSGLNDEMDRRCQALGGAGATATFTNDAACHDCAAVDLQNMVDRADATWGELRARVVSTGSMTVRAAAPAGVVFAAGSNAAVTLSIGEGSSFGDGFITRPRQQWHVTVRTFLDGQPGDADDGYIVIDYEDTDEYRHIVGTTTTQAFDSIEVTFDRPPDPDGVNDNVVGGVPASQPGSVRIHEFCGDFDLEGLQVESR